VTRTTRPWPAHVVAVAAATALAGCGTASSPEGAGSPTWSESAAPSAAAPTAPARLAEVTSACELLPAKVVIDLLGGNAQTRLKATEDPVENLEAGKRRYTCGYGRDGTVPFALTVSTRPGQASTATDAIDAIADASGVETRRVKARGTHKGGVGYVNDGFRLVALAVPYEDELRLVIFTGPQIVPHSKIAEVAQHVADQL
jgi:hypothetical protein